MNHWILKHQGMKIFLRHFAAKQTCHPWAWVKPLGHHVKTFGFNSPVVQWLGLPALTGEGPGSIPCQGTKFHKQCGFLFQSIVLHLYHSLKSPVKACFFFLTVWKLSFKKKEYNCFPMLLVSAVQSESTICYTYIPSLLSLPPASTPSPQLGLHRALGWVMWKLFFFSLKKEKYHSGVEWWRRIVLKVSRHSVCLSTLNLNASFQMPIWSFMQ